ncbi:Lrp/AsnC family transcriptional regulator [Methanomassiliicoccus luminyensis]|jgi:DNA-binding Lrp family transcriptional regulator|uniref:Lrp/AsnC family transcriptional regulator n=1 Tax=Methanomassiliicoccus luminyensis TaxID=1080712 RepID=UPI0003797137|nr:Lrp/AsnC family transcriptional regulator [Methanomassiliicoccus luminyensis]
MDQLDRKLLRILERDARITYRELSEKLGISIPSVQKRMVSLEGSGRILGYSAHISLLALGGSMVVIQGRSEADFAPDVVDELGKSDSVMTVMCGNQNDLVIGVFLRDLSELDTIVSYIREVGKVPDPEVLMVTPGSDITCTRGGGAGGEPQLSDLTALDLRIIWALHKNARRSISDVAEDIGISSKTVSRRLGRMVESGAIDFHVMALPNLDEDLMTVLHLRIGPDAPRQSVIRKVRDLPGDFIDEDLSFSNEPDLIMFVLFTQNLSELKDLLHQVRKIEGVVKISHDVILYQQYFGTWRDRLLAERVRSILSRNVRDGSPGPE